MIQLSAQGATLLSLIGVFTPSPLSFWKNENWTHLHFASLLRTSDQPVKVTESGLVVFFFQKLLSVSRRVSFVTMALFVEKTLMVLITAFATKVLKWLRQEETSHARVRTE